MSVVLTNCLLKLSGGLSGLSDCFNLFVTTENTDLGFTPGVDTAFDADFNFDDESYILFATLWLLFFKDGITKLFGDIVLFVV